MTRDEIYDHLAQVYIGKRKKINRKQKRQLSAWLVINILITAVIFTSAFYGLTAFLEQRRSTLRSSVIYTLHNGPIRLEYNFVDPLQPTQSFSLSVAQIDATKYKVINFSVRGKEEGAPGVMKIVFTNEKRETASYYIRDVGLDWQEFSIPLERFETITDWTTVTDVSFVLEAWNVDTKKGIVLIDGVSFSS